MISRAALAILVLVAAGCNSDDSLTPTGPEPIQLSTQYFTGTLSVGTTRFYSFTVGEPGGTASVMLASVTSPTTGAALPTVLGLGLGVPQGTGCAVTRSVNTGSRLTAQLSDSLVAGVYCVSLSDIGNLTADVNFALRFTHP